MSKIFYIVIFPLILLNGCSLYTSHDFLKPSREAQIRGWRDGYIGKEMDKTVVENRYERCYEDGYNFGSSDRNSVWNNYGTEKKGEPVYVVGMIDGYLDLGMNDAYLIADKERYMKGYEEGKQGLENNTEPELLRLLSKAHIFYPSQSDYYYPTYYYRSYFPRYYHHHHHRHRP